jgi:hypothetical protein
MGAWVSPNTEQRRYILPTGTPCELALEWLAQKALPEYAPEAMRRARAASAWPPELVTRREIEASEALKKLEQDYRHTKDDLQAALSKARPDADQIRDGLLHGTGRQLVETVALVLDQAGIRAVDLQRRLPPREQAARSGSSRRVAHAAARARPRIYGLSKTSSRRTRPN